MKKFKQTREKFDGWIALILWLPALFIGRSIFYLAVDMVCDTQRFFEFNSNDINLLTEGVFYVSIIYAVYFACTFAYALFIRCLSARKTRFGRFAYSVPLMLFFAAEAVVCLSAIFTTLNGAQVLGWGIGFIAVTCALMFALLSGMWLFRVYVNPANPALTVVLGYICSVGTILSYIAAAYIEGLWAHIYLISASIVGAAFALDITFKGIAYKIIEKITDKILKKIFSKLSKFRVAWRLLRAFQTLLADYKNPENSFASRFQYTLNTSQNCMAKILRLAGKYLQKNPKKLPCEI